MNKIKYVGFILLASLALLHAGCTNGFEDLNENPKSLPEVNPEELFYSAQIKTLTPGHAWNSIFASKFRWMQYGAGIWGYSTVQFEYFSDEIGNAIYKEYNEMGGLVTNMHYLIDKLPENEAQKYVKLRCATRILLISKAIQTSDLFGSLAYSEAWQARNGKSDPESLTPRFETQEELVEIWDKQLQECIQELKAVENAANQVALTGYDRAYNGDTKKWIKAANGIRLRLASRIWNIKPEKAKSMATEILAPANADYLFSSNDDRFVLWYDVNYTNVNPGDWHSIVDMEIASPAIMDYLVRNEDPRKRMYFVINNLTPENIQLFNAQQEDESRLIPEDYTRWMGSTIVIEEQKDDRRRDRYYLSKDGEQIDMRPANKPQVRLWKGNDTQGNGANWAPIMTYADFALLAAEFVLRENIPSAKTAQQWYEDGVKASLDHWNHMGEYCDIADYEPMTSEEIAAFLDQADIKWSNDKTKALEQIYAQVYVEHYKNVDEMYAFWKRTNYPNINSEIIKFEQPANLGIKHQVPRRVKFSYPNEGTHNSENMKQRIMKMEEDPKFGDKMDEYGRLWWDAQ
ncbi:MAG: SusD/RagB family nutrient-binding outer membrane lipoprotein [Tannerellaceae bacterium]|nr:SusD/RagB family nutrient-binding outer membrane lipoprotein [Tannerellaceae bacterium]